MLVTHFVVADHAVPHALVDGESPEDGQRVVDLVVMADPRADHPPHGLPCWVSSQEANLGWLAT